ncbi:MAG: TAXI family TRAP transporter solute-binding subunit [Deltaproteobacteria bacterium]|nr:TAXI family TRAP transporter solute-binding subunit [Deltaproteobacteria bacterium]
MMTLRKTLMFCLVLALGFLGWGHPQPASAASKKQLAMGSTQSSSSHYAYFVAVAKVINAKVPEVNISVVETGASVDNINRMKKGDLDMGMTTVHVQYQAYHGLGVWKDKPIKDQYVLWVYQAAPQNFVVREDSGVKTVQDLAGKPFNPGMRGSATEKTAESILSALGVVPNYYRGGTEDTVASIKDKRTVGYVKSGAGVDTLDASTLDIATFTPIRLLGFTPKDIATVQAKFPFLSTVSLPKGLYKDSPAYKTFAMLIGVAAKKDLPEDLVYKMVKSACENIADQVAAYPSIKGVNLAKLTLETSTVPLHPGAIKYYKELGLKIPDNLIPK